MGGKASKVEFPQNPSEIYEVKAGFFEEMCRVLKAIHQS
jgi:hypothetical protein